MSKKIAYYSVFASLAILMGYVEAVVQIPVPIPGVKLGLSNIIVLLCMYVMGVKEAFYISIVRVVVSALLFRGFLGVWYSLAGAFLSYFTMIIAYKLKNISVIGVSVVGGIFHNIGQITVAYFMLGRNVVIYLIPVLIISGVITGFIIGIISKYCMEYVKRKI